MPNPASNVDFCGGQACLGVAAARSGAGGIAIGIGLHNVLHEAVTDDVRFIEFHVTDAFDAA
jgi:hypothetical protein